jgi:hypothetical protein
LATGARSRPVWSQGVVARLYAQLTLIGAWTSAPEDVDSVASITGRRWPEIEDELVASSRLADPPFLRTSGGWQVASPDGAWSLLHDAVQTADIRRFIDQALLILAETNPSVERTAEERMLASLRGERPRFSPALRQGVAQGIALLGASDFQLADSSAGTDHAASAVGELLRRANDDSSTRIWRSLSQQLQLLAEAAPDEFLSAVETGLKGDSPPLLQMFEDHKVSLSAASSPHTGLLWALEMLSWSPDHLSAATMALARLAEIDPHGSPGNRPDGSLRAVFLPWHPRTGASLPERLQVLDYMRRAHGEVAWALELVLLPATHDTTLNTPVPKFRRWQTAEQPAPIAEWLEAISGILDFAIADASTSGERWGQLIQHVGSLPQAQLDLLLNQLEMVSVKLVSQSDRALLWQSLTQLIGHHRDFPGARWVLPEASLARLEAVAQELRPDGPIEAYAHLFDWRPHLQGVDPREFAQFDEALRQVRSAALEAVYQHDGFEGVERLARAAKLPGAVGACLAAAHGDAPSARMLDLLSGDEAGRSFAAGWIQRRVHDDPRWFERVGPVLASMSVDVQLGFVIALRVPDAPLLKLLGTLSQDAQDRYWQRVVPVNVDDQALVSVVEHLLAYKRPWTAIDLLALALSREAKDSPPIVDSGLVLRALESAVDGGVETDLSGRAAYEVGKLFDYLEHEGTDRTTMSQLEWLFFSLTEHVRAPRALFSALASDPQRFVDLVCTVYRAKHGTQPRVADERSRAGASQAWALLREWRIPPGLAPDGAWNVEQLRAWVRAARLGLSDRDRADIGDQQIGQLLSGSAKGSDGAWPAEGVRDLIDEIGSLPLETGIMVGVEEARGVTVRGPYDGGAQELELVKQYRASSSVVVNRWPRTGRLLRNIADHYEREARRQDVLAQDSAAE